MLTTRAYAKINLGLRILRKRADGYHDIETVFHRVNIFDEITLSPSTDVSLTSSSPELPVDEENLCLRAALLLKKTFGVRDGADIHLAKNIPIGAGLGGGSSDAASTLHGLNRLWSLHLPQADLEPLALQIGSDVPFFLGESSAYATGRGEHLEYFNLEVPYWIVVVYPNLHISTAWAFSNTRIANPQSTIPHPQSPISLRTVLLDHLNEPSRLIPLLPNDFEPLVLRTHPVVALVKKQLYHLGADFAQLTGSGSSLYGFFTTQAAVETAMAELRKEYRVFLTEPRFAPLQVPKLK